MCLVILINGLLWTRPVISIASEQEVIDLIRIVKRKE